MQLAMKFAILAAIAQAMFAVASPVYGEEDTNLPERRELSKRYTLQECQVACSMGGHPWGTPAWQQCVDQCVSGLPTPPPTPPKPAPKPLPAPPPANQGRPRTGGRKRELAKRYTLQECQVACSMGGHPWGTPAWQQCVDQCVSGLPTPPPTPPKPAPKPLPAPPANQGRPRTGGRKRELAKRYTVQECQVACSMGGHPWGTPAWQQCVDQCVSGLPTPPPTPPKPAPKPLPAPPANQGRPRTGGRKRELTYTEDWA
ncbi:hypothetical protein AB1N83_013350 [Pleurotus pulmonarius]|nr:hypothetical protein EYR36_011666 [Pleurotus pulmonarius]KAF4607431.1 hypothetical protein EYR38_001502 [Pleurotus pulmonarius]